MACVLVVAGIDLSKVLHDEIPSSVRAGVASGVGSASSLVFLACALCFGFVTDRFGVPAGGWIVVALCIVMVLVLARVATRGPAPVGHPRASGLRVELGDQNLPLERAMARFGGESSSSAMLGRGWWCDRRSGRSNAGERGRAAGR